MKCNICKKKCDGKLVIGDFLCDGGDFIVCAGCFNQYANQEYDELTKKLEMNYKLD